MEECLKGENFHNLKIEEKKHTVKQSVHIYEVWQFERRISLVIVTVSNLTLQFIDLHNEHVCPL